jgi:ABC-2 type transport system permease protein
MFRSIAIKQAVFELGTWLRNGEQALLNFVIPIAVYVALSRTSSTREMDNLSFSSLMAISASCFAGLAISTAFDRRYGALKLLGMTPLGKTGFVTARILTALLIAAIQFSLIVITAVALRETVQLSGLLVLALGLSVTAWTSWALVLAATLRAEAVLAIANTFFIIFSVSAFVFIDSASAIVLMLNPLSAALALAAGNLTGLISLIVWSVIGFMTARHRFTWV